MSNPKPPSTYVPHINGLRALAILGVLIYHLRADYCPAGYFGVDLFLVISGYLLLRSLLKPGAEMNFHYGSYLLKKAWRILPSWFVATLVVCAVSFLLLHPGRLPDIIKTARYSAIFQADYHIDRSGDYFNIFSQQNPMLHYWYLSITQQLYIIVPLLLIPTVRLVSRRAAIILLAVLSLLSFAYYITTTSNSLVPDALKEALLHSVGTKTAYYHLIPRFWEIAAGFGVFLLPEFATRQKLRALLGALGLIGIIVSYYLYNTGSPAIYLTVVCSLLTLRYASTGIAATLLNSKPLQALGTISFSLYLWHWPVMVFWKYCCFDSPGMGDEAGMLALSLLLGTLSWWGIERIKIPSRPGWVGTLLRCSLLLTLPLILISANKANKYARSNTMQQQREFITAAETETDAAILKGMEGLAAHNATRPLLRMGRAEGAPCFLFIGDSHSGHLYDALHERCKVEGLRGVFLNNSVAPFWNLHQAQAGSDTCCWNKNLAELHLDYLRQHPEIRCVIVALSWEFRFRGLQVRQLSEALGRDWRSGKAFNTVEERLAVTGPGIGEFCDQIRALGREVALVGCTPGFPIPPLDEWERCQKLHLPYKGRHVTAQEHEQNNAFAYGVLRKLQDEGRAHFIDLAPSLMVDGVYPDRLEGKFLYLDASHLTNFGERIAVDYMMPRLRRIMGLPEAPAADAGAEGSSTPAPAAGAEAPAENGETTSPH